MRDIYLQMDVSRGFHLVPKMVRGGVEICKMLTNSKQGVECKFVEPPPAAPQTDCPVCLLVLREPYQVTCCGKSYCKSYIVCVIRAGKLCPCCLQDINNHFPNKGLQQPLYGFKVHATTHRVAVNGLVSWDSCVATCNYTLSRKKEKI